MKVRVAFLPLLRIFSSISFDFWDFFPFAFFLFLLLFLSSSDDDILKEESDSSSELSQEEDEVKQIAWVETVLFFKSC